MRFVLPTLTPLKSLTLQGGTKTLSFKLFISCGVSVYKPCFPDEQCELKTNQTHKRNVRFTAEYKDENEQCYLGNQTIKFFNFFCHVEMQKSRPTHEHRST